MQCKKYLLVFGFTIIQFSCFNAFGVTRDEIMKQIVSGEEKYVTLIIKFTADVQHKIGKEYVQMAPPAEYVFSLNALNGRFKRLDLFFFDKNGTKESRRELSDGKTYSNWQFSSRDMQGAAIIEPASEEPHNMSIEDLLCPFSFYGGDNNDLSFSIEDELVRLHWKDFVKRKVEATYRAEGESLIPVNYVFYSLRQDGSIRERTVVRYDYEEDVLKRITKEFPDNELMERMVYTLTDLDFNPQFSKGHFKIAFRKGTRVTDKIRGIRYPYGLRLPWNTEKLAADSNGLRTNPSQVRPESSEGWAGAKLVSRLLVAIGVVILVVVVRVLVRRQRSQ